MEEHVHQNDFSSQLTPSANFTENSCYQQHHIVKEEGYVNLYSPGWTEYQHTDPCYVEYLAGNGIQTSYKNTTTECSFKPDGSFLNMAAHQGIYPRLQHEQVPVNNFISMQHEGCYQKQYLDKGQDNVAKHPTSTKSRSTYSRQKATDTDRRRRTRIAAALDALDGLLPHSKEGNKTNIVDDCIYYIKYLQLHMKELCQNRLGGESTPNNNFTFLEGYGHYLVHENMACGPLEDMLGKMLETNPSIAAKLLESRGLYMMPIAP